MWLVLFMFIKLHSSAAIINQPSSSRGQLSAIKSGSLYLNSERPLWILDDQVPQRDIERITFTTARPDRPHYYYTSQRQRRKHHQNTRRRYFKMPRSIKLPSHYLNRLQPQNLTTANGNYGNYQMQVRRQQYYPRTSQLRLNMPTFDSLPGEDMDESMPIFIYNGPKGELILNTMLSTRKYPMHEPVPGQTLYPPNAPIFRPKPIVQRFRVPGGQEGETLNLTLIPFYAHEAINPRSLGQDTNTPTSLKVETSTSAPLPTVMYAAEVPPYATPAPLPPTKMRRYKKAKQYAVYRSPHEVQWQPMIPAIEQSTTTAFPLALASPLENHRYANMRDELLMPTSTAAPQPLSNFKLTYKDEKDHFQIVYVDESIEKPTTVPTRSPLPLSSSYTESKELYAFPVFTLGKLLKPEVEKRKHMKYLTENALPSQRQQEAPKMEKENTDTWFILNSRYKGHHKHNNKYRLSSKYVQNAVRDSTITAPLSTAARVN